MAPTIRKSFATILAPTLVLVLSIICILSTSGQSLDEPVRDYTYVGGGRERVNELVSYFEKLNSYNVGNLEEREKQNVFISLPEAATKLHRLLDGLSIEDKCSKYYKLIKQPNIRTVGAVNLLAQENSLFSERLQPDSNLVSRLQSERSFDALGRIQTIIQALESERENLKSSFDPVVHKELLDCVNYGIYRHQRALSGLASYTRDSLSKLTESAVNEEPSEVALRQMRETIDEIRAIELEEEQSKSNKTLAWLGGLSRLQTQVANNRYEIPKLVRDFVTKPKRLERLHIVSDAGVEFEVQPASGGGQRDEQKAQGGHAETAQEDKQELSTERPAHAGVESAEVDTQIDDVVNTIIGDWADANSGTTESNATDIDSVEMHKDDLVINASNLTISADGEIFTTTGSGSNATHNNVTGSSLYADPGPRKIDGAVYRITDNSPDMEIEIVHPIDARNVDEAKRVEPEVDVSTHEEADSRQAKDSFEVKSANGITNSFKIPGLFEFTGNSAVNLPPNEQFEAMRRGLHIDQKPMGLVGSVHGSLATSDCSSVIQHLHDSMSTFSYEGIDLGEAQRLAQLIVYVSDHKCLSLGQDASLPMGGWPALSMRKKLFDWCKHKLEDDLLSGADKRTIASLGDSLRKITFTT